MPSRSVRTTVGTRSRERRERATSSDGRSVVAADLDRGDPRSAGARAAPGSPGSALPWWATLSTSTGPSSSGSVTLLSASAVSSIENPPASSRETTAWSFGLPVGRARPRGGHSTLKRSPPTVDRLARGGRHRPPARARPARPAASAGPPSSSPRRRRRRAAARTRGSPPAPLPRGRPRRASARARPALDVRLARAASGSARPAGPVSTSTEVPPSWISVASPWPTSRNETTSSPGAWRGARRRGAGSRDHQQRRASATSGAAAASAARPRRRGARARRPAAACAPARAATQPPRATAPAASRRGRDQPPSGDHGRRRVDLDHGEGAAAVTCATVWR